MYVLYDSIIKMHVRIYILYRYIILQFYLVTSQLYIMHAWLVLILAVWRMPVISDVCTNNVTIELD